ncbi:MAG: hypothetical protein INR65_03235 [Gluconacetobacter diazotrophicus]|nr:hypothetical protein [Gluconacetobacter diazotrophicus]
MADDFPLLRASLAPAYAALPPDQLAGLVRAVYGPAAEAEDVESLFGDIGHAFGSAARAVGHFAQQAAPVVANALPAMASGAATGAALGPWGALAGAVAGGVGGALSQSRNRTARAIGGGIGNLSSLVGTVRGGGPAGALGALGAIAGGRAGAGASPAGLLAPPGGNSANALLALLSRPETLQALTAGAMGRFGRQQVPSGGGELPVQLLLGALGTLASRSAHEAAEYDEAATELPEHVSSAGEAFGLDTEDAEGRTDTLLTLLALSPAIWPQWYQPPPQRPVNVTVTAPPPTPEPAVVTAGEDVWIDELGEDEVDLAAWESADPEDWGEDWPEAWAAADPSETATPPYAHV